MSAGDLAWTKSASLRCAADGLIHETPTIGGRALAKMGRLAEMAEQRPRQGAARPSAEAPERGEEEDQCEPIVILRI